MKDTKREKIGTIVLRRTEMSLFETIINKILIFEKEPQRIGLSQFKDDEIIKKKVEPSIKNKDVKLSDLMRRAS